MQPGDYLWAPEVAPAGPLLLIVSIKTQRAYLYRNGIPIGISTASTGRPGHDTPTGVFTILQKRVDHRSNLYNNAPMPYMQRLTWDGIALHAGNISGYPASHGCIRLPLEFARLLYDQTSLGMTVVITDDAAVPRVAPMPSFLTQGADAALDTLAGTVEWHPDRSPDGPISIVVSTSDRRILVMRNGVPIGSAPARVDADIGGPMAYALTRGADGKPGWMALALDGNGHDGRALTSDEISRLRLPPDFRRRLAAVLVPGTTFVITSDSLRAGSPGGKLTVVDTVGKP